MNTHYRNLSSDHTGGETPVPIPNTAVKLSKADGTNEAVRWESRKLLDFAFSLPRVVEWVGMGIEKPRFQLKEKRGFLLFRQDVVQRWKTD